MADKIKAYITILSLMLIIALVAFLAGGRYALDRRGEVVVVRTDTLTIHDTIRIDRPVPVETIVTEKIFVPVKDTLRLRDTLYISIDREQKRYEAEQYRAWVSGYQPRLDSIEVYNKTQIITNTIEKYRNRRWSVGVQAGVGAAKDGLTPYIGIGVAYSLFSF